MREIIHDARLHRRDLSRDPLTQRPHLLARGHDADQDRRSLVPGIYPALCLFRILNDGSSTDHTMVVSSGF
jgi:hypothetical protein